MRTRNTTVFIFSLLLITGLAVAASHTVTTSAAVEAALAEANLAQPSPYPTTTAFVQAVCKDALTISVQQGRQRKREDFCQKWPTLTQPQRDNVCTITTGAASCYPCGQ